MRTVMLSLLVGLLILPVACRPKMTQMSTIPMTTAQAVDMKKLLIGKWELLAGRPGQQYLPWLNQRSDFTKGRTIEFTKDNELVYRRAEERTRISTYRFLTPDTLEIDLVKLLAGDAPSMPLTDMKLHIEVKDKELTLQMVDDKQKRYDRYRRIEEAKHE